MKVLMDMSCGAVNTNANNKREDKQRYPKTFFRRLG
jgi:hypothetical protein